jgi:hypothetical protein
VRGKEAESSKLKVGRGARDKVKAEREAIGRKSRVDNGLPGFSGRIHIRRKSE